MCAYAFLRFNGNFLIATHSRTPLIPCKPIGSIDSFYPLLYYLIVPFLSNNTPYRRRNISYYDAVALTSIGMMIGGHFIFG